MSESPPLDRPGSVIAGRYRVEELLGRGGMAAVYRVQDERAGRALALKRSYARDPAHLPKRRTLLEREYYTLAQLAHPRIIEVYDFGVDGLGPFYTMELLDGKDLHDSGRLPWREACAVLRDVASSLALLHARGLVHRDVSTRNVRCTSDGRAKLIDFGAMVSLGVSTNVAGTPPFLAPEAVQIQALDGRADLFSLGALGYCMLTGRHAYPARRLSELRDVWRTQPAPIARIVPEVPQPLSALIMELLSLDRSARPQSASDTILRLCALAGLPCDEPAASRAYLTAPALVGRQRTLIDLRKRMLSLVRGDGACLLVEGEPGSGRSRVLDACALEGKMISATVLRADARDSAAHGDWGVARALMQRLVEHLPSEVKEAARLSREPLVQGFLSHELAAEPANFDRALLIRELRDLVLSVARTRRLLLIVDDVDGIDEPSAAWLAALAHKTERHALMLALGVEPSQDRVVSGALRLLRASSDCLTLAALEPADTEALLRGLFGDIKHTQLIAGRVHAVARGNPGTTMELAQHLVDRGLARFAAGSWSLPAQLDEGDLPPSLAGSQGARIAQLSPDALELARVLAAADGDTLALADYAGLLTHADPRRTFSALDELVAARILVGTDAGYVFSQRSLLSLIQHSAADDDLRRIHARIGDLLDARAGDALRRVHHRLLAGRAREAVELLCSLDLHVSMPPLALLERALDAAERHALAAAHVHKLRWAVLTKAPYVLAFDSFRRVWPATVTRLEQDSGLADYTALSELPEAERLTRALERARERYAATPERERVHDVFAAIRRLALVQGSSLSFGVAAIDPEFIEGVPDIRAFLPLSPAFALANTAWTAVRHWVVGRYQHARDLYGEMLQRMSEPDRAGLGEIEHARIDWSLRFLTMQLDAAVGVAIEERVQQLEREPSMRASAWHLRQVFALSQGDLEEARRCMKRAELARLQHLHEQYFVGMTSTIELLTAAQIGDLRAVKGALQSVALLAAASPGWKPLLAIGESRYRLMQGDPAGALECLQPAFAAVQPGKHLAYVPLAALHLDILTRLGELDHAIELGQRYLAICRQHELLTGALGVDTSLAEALRRAGRLQEAKELTDARIATADQRKLIGVSTGSLFELRARIALAEGDRANFEHFARRCAEEFKRGKNPTLNARFARLLDEASERVVDARVSLLPALKQLEAESVSELATVHSRMRECVDAAERGRCALTLLLQDVESFHGSLFQVLDGDLQLMASVPDEAPEEGVSLWANAWLAEALEESSVVTSRRGSPSEDSETGEDITLARYTDARGRELAPVLLRTAETEARIAALFLFEVTRDSRNIPTHKLIHELAEELLGA